MGYCLEAGEAEHLARHVQTQETINQSKKEESARQYDASVMKSAKKDLMDLQRKNGNPANVRQCRYDEAQPSQPK